VLGAKAVRVLNLAAVKHNARMSVADARQTPRHVGAAGSRALDELFVGARLGNDVVIEEVVRKSHEVKRFVGDVAVVGKHEKVEVARDLALVRQIVEDFLVFETLDSSKYISDVGIDGTAGFSMSRGGTCRARCSAVCGGARLANSRSRTSRRDGFLGFRSRVVSAMA
jgi:hypothetical protein